MIPGNHDWYDGLQTFCRFICNRNWFGGWFMPQTSSYFVNALPHNWWIFAVDYALNGDMDTKQFQYFAKIVESYFDDDVRAERVIIMTHQPDWIINDHEGSNLGENLRYLINNIIGHDRLRLRLAGDIHNYTRHETRSAVQSGFKYNMMEKRKKRSVSTESNKPVKNGNKLHFQDIPLQSSTRNLKRNMKRSRSLDNINFLSDKSYNDPTLIVSGGGGAFLHPTHVPEKKPIFYNDAIYERVCEYPSVLKSRAYAFFNIFGFRKRNLSFDLLGGIAYYLMVSSLFPLCNLQINSHLEEIKWSTLLSKYCQIFVQVTFEVFERSYISITVLIMAIIGMYVWTEAHLSIRTRCTITIVHVVTHYVASMTVIILMEMIIEAALENELIGKKSAFDTFQTHFKLTQDVLQHIDNHYTFGVITYILKMLFTVVDITGFHVSLRKSMCSSKYKQIELILQQFKDYPAETLFSLSKVNGELYNIVPSRFSRFLYHTTAFLFYFIFAAPVVSFVIGIYLFVSAKFGKYNEAFSSLRLDTFKNFVRFHLKYDGSLHCYVIGVDKVPHRWRQDPKWDGRGQLASIDIDNTDNNNNNDSIKRETVCDKIISSPNKQYNQESSQRTMIRDMRYLGPSYTWNYPSRWIPYNSSGDTNMSSKHEYRRVQIIDQFVLH